MSTLADLLVYALAAGAIVDLIQNGSLFARMRALLDLRGGYWHELVSCPFCFNHAAALALAVLLYTPSLTGPRWLGTFGHVVAFGFAAGRVARLLDGILPDGLKNDRTAKIDNG